MATKTQADVYAMRKIVDEFIDEHGLRGDARWYTCSEWNRRGESYGRTAYVTLVIDGSPLYEIINYGPFGTGSTFDAFEKMMKTTGFWYEMGYAWSLHFYAND